MLNLLSVKITSSAFIILLLISGCGGGSSDSSPPTPPNILNLNLSSLIVGTVIEADVTFVSSTDITSIKTEVISVPSDSQMLNQEFTGTSFVLTFDTIGDFTLNVTVSDSLTTVSQEFEFTIGNIEPVAHVTGLNKSNLFTQITLSGQDSSDSDNHSLTYSWTLIEKPDSSELDTNLGNAVEAQLYPDKKGDYTVSLTVSDGYGGENTTEFTFATGAFKLRRLTFNVVDAVYSDTLDKLLIIGDDKKFYIYSPETYETQVVSLSYQGNAVSVLPDGSKAAIGHDANISLIDIKALVVERVYPVSTDVFDIEISTNGYVYAMPRTDQWETLRAINLENGKEEYHLDYSIWAGTIIKMHPSQKYIYGAVRGLSPSDIEKYDISEGKPKYLYDSPYHGDYSMCGDLWISQDGQRIFTRCGNVFRASEIPDLDMTYNGRLELEGQISALSQKDNSIYFVDDSTPNILNYYSYEFLENEGSDELPFELKNGTTFMTEARFVFHRKDGSVISLVEIDSDSGYLLNYALAYVPSKIESTNTKSIAIIDENEDININDITSISAQRARKK